MSTLQGIALLLVFAAGLTGGFWLAEPPSMPPQERVWTRDDVTAWTPKILAAMEADDFTVSMVTYADTDGFAIGRVGGGHANVNENLEPSHRDRVLLHEWAHLLLGHVYATKHQPEHELDAEVVARAVAVACGFAHQEQLDRMAEFAQGAPPMTPDRNAAINRITRHMHDALTS